MRLSHLVSERFALLIGMFEIGVGLLLYGYPQVFAGEPRLAANAPELSALFLVGGLGTLIMIRHAIPRRLNPLRSMPPAAPWLVATALIWGSALAGISLICGLLGMTTLALQPGGNRQSLPQDRFDLVDLLGGIQQLAVGVAILAVPSAAAAAWMSVICLVGGAALLSKPWWAHRSARAQSLCRWLCPLPSILITALAILSHAYAAVFFCIAMLFAMLLFPELPPRPQAQDSGDLVPIVAKRVEIGIWALASAAVVLALLEDASGDRLMRPAAMVVLMSSVYNPVAHWLFPKLGPARGRLRAHLLFFMAGAAVMLILMGNGPIAQASILLLVIPPMLAAQAFGFRAALPYLLLGTAAVIVADFWQMGASFTHIADPRLYIRALLYLVAGTMANRSAAQQRQLVKELHEKEQELRSANDDLAVQREELTAQQEELAAQNEALAESAAALAKMANFDPLTGLSNRRSFQSLLHEELQRARRDGSCGAIVFLDLDRFKYINDSLGHTAGDHLLQRAAAALTRAVADRGTVARLGGDEFAALLPGADENRAGSIVEAMLGSLHEERLVVNDEEIPVRASAGIALYPGDSDTSEGLLQAADIAMYAAKEAGRDGFSLFCQCEARFVSGDPRVHWQREVQAALAEDRLLLHFQPVVESETGNTVSYEVLLRMRSREGELIYPDAFLPTLEQLPALMHAVDRWVVRRSFQVMAESLQKGKPLALQINLSGLSVTDPELLPLIEALLKETGVAPTSVTFEVTETANVPDTAECRRFVQQLRSLGCGVATDDFGGGFATLTRLRNMPVQQLKIAGSLVQNLSARPQDVPIVRAIVEMAKGMGIETVAEWVEDKQTYELMKDLWVDYVQGYLFGHPAESPVPAEKVDKRAPR